VKSQKLISVRLEKKPTIYVNILLVDVAMKLNTMFVAAGLFVVVSVGCSCRGGEGLW
jgi:hypothetical protein